MAGQNEETMAPTVEPTPTDPWAAAFAALDKEDEEAVEAAPDADGGDEGGAVPSAEGADAGEDSAGAEADDGVQPEDGVGGPGDLGGEDGEEDVRFDWGDLDVSEESVAQFRESFTKEIQDRAITEVARAYIKQGARHQNGRLGATINDPDVCKRDSDGVPRFYNPETGREFMGDNPRRQAQEWVDDYNRELADAFNKTCRDYEQRLMQQEGARLAVVEFAPKYQALDPMRRSMFDSIIEDYEVTDRNGDVIGYSCDLDKALAAVNRQVRTIQKRFSGQKSVAPAAPPTGPALDTPSTTSNTAGNGKPQFKSIEEAMEWEQDQLLAKMKGSAR